MCGKPILVENNTCEVLGDSFEVESHGLVQLKGKTIEVEVFSVTAKI